MAKEFDSAVKEITDIRVQRSRISINTYLEKQSVIRNQYFLQAAINQNQSGEEYLNNIAASRENIDRLNRDFDTALDTERNLVATLQETYGGFDNLVNQMNDRYPILFFPVRIETVFMDKNGPELWVRIFPDDIAVETHEEDLTQSEIDEGMAYWRSFANAPGDVEKIHAWDLLCRSFGAERAAWVALQMQPTNLPAPPTPPPPSDQLIFPTLVPKSDAWSKQPVTHIMPDAFVIYAYDYNGNVTTFQTSNIPDELKMGIDPTLDPDTQSISFDQQDVNGRMNELVANPDVDWMINFDAAIASGLGARIAISAQQFDQGFQKILVLGVKATLTVEASQSRLESLIKSHHYTDGFSLLKQGTSTNNSDTDYSGYSFVEFGNPTTYKTERLDPLFTPVFTQRQKTDGQVLCEALGIEYDLLYHIFQANGTDISSSMSINNLLYQVSFGYTANELMPIFGTRRSNNNELRQFFSDYVRSRGALPSIRSGTQPYGILPASVYSRINWDTDPNAGLYRRLFEYTQALDVHWTNAIASFDGIGLAQGRAASPPSGSPAQQLSDILTAHAVSTSYVQRVGVGAGYIWNNLQYAALKYKELSDQWSQEQMERMNYVVKDSGLPLDFTNKAVQINYLKEQSSIEIPLVAGPNVPEDGPLPRISNSGNMLELLHAATFDELRDENYEMHGVPEDITESELKRNMLYRFTRQSLMLEYYEAACELLGIPDERRGEAEFINIIEPGSPPAGLEAFASPPQESGPMGRLTYGASRLQLMATPFNGYESVGAFLSSGELQGIPEAHNLIEARESLLSISKSSVRELGLLTAELVDAVSYRLDTWRLALVNQRLNALRGITEGSSSRNKGLYLGAYGWVTDVVRNTELQQVPPPSSQFEPDILRDLRNKGFIHAPSINQAVTGAVMLSGYKNRADQNMEDPLSINLSSERVRAALDIMDGIRNGQNLSVLLGYEFERRFRALYQDPQYVNQFISGLRNHFPLESFVVEVTPDPSVVDKVKARNVVSGAKLVEVFKTSGITDIVGPIGAAGTAAELPITQSVNWIWNLMDAVGDIALSEGLFHVVQGNPVKGGALADALSKGNMVAEPDILDSIKSGLEVGQRFTMHFKTLDTPQNGWNTIGGVSYRRNAEPYVNAWLSELLPDPTTLFCNVIINGDTLNPRPVFAADLGLQPIDLMYLVNEELDNDDSILSLIIKKYVRENSGTPGYTKDTTLQIIYGPEPEDGYFTFDEVLPVLLYARKIITSSRPLNTRDYMLPGDADSVFPLYNISELGNRLAAARSTLDTARTALSNALNSFSFSGVMDALYTLSKFGMEQTVYEFVHDTTPEDEDNLRAWGASVLALSHAKYDTSSPIAQPAPGDDPAPYVTSVIDCMKTIFGQSFAPLPLFQIRPAEQTYLALMASYSSTLKADHAMNDLLMEEWLTSMARVRKNTANYEMLSILASAVDFKSFHNLRQLLPMQLPYAGDGTERWLGASVTTAAGLKEGRIAIGASVPAGYVVSGDQVGIMIDDWIDVIPAKEQTSGISFHHNQPNAKAPQCLLLGLTPQITGSWRWNDLVDMLNETLDLAKKRAVDYERISSSVVGQLPAFSMPFAQSGNLIGLSGAHIVSVNP